jgi:hypothetical protein
MLNNMSIVLGHRAHVSYRPKGDGGLKAPEICTPRKFTILTANEIIYY